MTDCIWFALGQINVMLQFLAFNSSFPQILNLSVGGSVWTSRKAQQSTGVSFSIPGQELSRFLLLALNYTFKIVCRFFDWLVADL